uniref:Uncharacterized protein n=1 Tax=Ditylenchus dipsaci TaxID=166011 RepID=A0A915DTF1_9BILA
MLCSKNIAASLCWCYFASSPFVIADVQLDDGNPDEGPRKQMEFAKNTDMLPLYLQMNNVSIDPTTGNISVNLSKSQDTITLPLITKNAPKLSFSVTRSEGCLDGDSDRQTWELTTINGPKCALFINWKKETFTITTNAVDSIHRAGTYSYEIFHQNVCVARDGDVTVISGKGSSSALEIVIFFCSSMGHICLRVLLQQRLLLYPRRLQMTVF